MKKTTYYELESDQRYWYTHGMDVLCESPPNQSQLHYTKEDMKIFCSGCMAVEVNSYDDKCKFCLEEDKLCGI